MIDFQNFSLQYGNQHKVGPYQNIPGQQAWEDRTLAAPSLREAYRESPNGMFSFDGYDYSQDGGSPRRVGVTSQGDRYQGDSYLRGLSKNPEYAYDLETKRLQGQQQADAQRAGAVGQYGSAVAGSLANQSIAAGNTFGQMANNYYNTLGQMGHMGAALSAAGLAASSNAANAQMANSLGINFGVGGPGGQVASGALGGLGGGMTSVQRGGGPDERQRMLGQGFDYLGTAMGHLNSPNNQAMALAGLANTQFDQNRQATMNPMFLNSMTPQAPRAPQPPQVPQARRADPQANYWAGIPGGRPRQPAAAATGQQAVRASEREAAMRHWNGGSGNAGQGFATRTT